MRSRRVCQSTSTLQILHHTLDGASSIVCTSYPMMTSCWATNKDERPSFSELAEMLGSRLSDLLPQEAL